MLHPIYEFENCHCNPRQSGPSIKNLPYGTALLAELQCARTSHPGPHLTAGIFQLIVERGSQRQYVQLPVRLSGPQSCYIADGRNCDFEQPIYQQSPTSDQKALSLHNPPPSCLTLQNTAMNRSRRKGFSSQVF